MTRNVNMNVCSSVCICCLSHTLTHFQLLWLSLNKVASSSGKKWAWFCSVWLLPSTRDNTNPLCVCESLWLFKCALLCICVSVFIHSFYAHKLVCMCVMRPDIHLPTESAAGVHYFTLKSLQAVESCRFCACHFWFLPVFSDKTLSAHLLFSASVFLNSFDKRSGAGVQQNKSPSLPAQILFRVNLKTQMCQLTGHAKYAVFQFTCSRVSPQNWDTVSL